MSMVLHPQYITDQAGNRVSVVIPLGEYEDLMEDLEDLAAIADRREEDTIPHSVLVAGLKRDGIV